MVREQVILKVVLAVVVQQYKCRMLIIGKILWERFAQMLRAVFAGCAEENLDTI